MATMTELAHDQRPENWSAAASGYEEAFAPYTGPYADEALRLAGLVAGERVLDVAAGSGALSLRAARLGAEVLATDFAPGMVELLRARCDAEGLDRCTVAEMDGQALEVPDASFDLAVSMFGLIFFPDMGAGLREMARATRPGGRVCVTTWRLAGFRLVDLVRTAFSRAIPGFDPPQAEPVWARIGDADGLRGWLTEAGLDAVEVHTVTQRWVWDDPAEFFRRLPDWSPPVQPLFEALDEPVVERAAAAFVEVIDEAEGGGSGLDVDALIGIGRRV